MAKNESEPKNVDSPTNSYLHLCPADTEQNKVGSRMPWLRWNSVKLCRLDEPDFRLGFFELANPYASKLLSLSLASTFSFYT